MAQHAAAGVPLHGPVLLDVFAWCACLVTEALDDGRQHGASAVGSVQPGQVASRWPFVDRAQHPGPRPVGRRVDGQGGRRAGGERLARQPVGTPERFVVDDVRLHDRSAGHALVQERPVERQHRLIADLACDRDGYGDDDSARPHRHVLGVHGDAVVVGDDAPHRLVQVQCVAELGGDRSVDRPHAAHRSGVLRRVLHAEQEARAAARRHLIQHEQHRHLGRRGRMTTRERRFEQRARLLGQRVAVEPAGQRHAVPFFGVLGGPRRLERYRLRHAAQFQEDGAHVGDGPRAHRHRNGALVAVLLAVDDHDRLAVDVLLVARHAELPHQAVDGVLARPDPCASAVDPDAVGAVHGEGAPADAVARFQ